MNHTSFPNTRTRRLRHHPAMRNLVREVTLTPNDFVFPLFIRPGKEKKAIKSMPGIFQLTISDLKKEVQEIKSLGIPSIMLFGIPEHKDSVGSDSYSDNGIIQTAIKEIREHAPDLLIMSDICFCEYMDHGHCGVMNEKTGKMDLDNDATLELLVKQSISHVKAGTDVIAPSGMIDGMVGAIRKGLDQENFKHIPILSYSVKYASNLYGPFREAAEGAPKFGDRKTHQMDFANTSDGIRECLLDLEEGADILMVKPAHTYLDVIAKIKQRFPEVPLAAYHPSGEFAMLKAAIQNGWLTGPQVVLEVLTAIKRAGANFILTYFAKEIAPLL